MGFVDGEKIDLGLPQGVDRVVAHEPLGRDIEKPERSLVEAARDPPAFVGIGRRIEARRLDAGLAQLGDLVAHQRDQRRHHQGEAAADDPRKLEEKRLAAARRHDREHVLARERGGEDVLLSGTKVREAEDGRERRARLRHDAGNWAPSGGPAAAAADAGRLGSVWHRATSPMAAQRPDEIERAGDSSQALAWRASSRPRFSARFASGSISL